MWSNTAKGGQHGFYVVLLSIVFWTKLVKTKTDQKDLESALEDVPWVMDKSIEQLYVAREKGGGKRSGDENDATPSKR